MWSIWYFSWKVDIENIVGKTENATDQHFLLFIKFPKAYLIPEACENLGLCCKGLTLYQNTKRYTGPISKKSVVNNSNVVKIVKLVLDRVENIVGKGENAGYKHFLLFPTMFSKVYFLRVCGKRLKDANLLTMSIPFLFQHIHHIILILFTHQNIQTNCPYFRQKFIHRSFFFNTYWITKVFSYCHRNI